MAIARWQSDANAGREALENANPGIALRRLTKALVEAQKDFDFRAPELDPILLDLARTFCVLGMYARARAFYRRLLGLMREVEGGDSPEIDTISTMLAMIADAEEASPNNGGPS